jgi:hypothetical protein
MGTGMCLVEWESDQMIQGMYLDTKISPQLWLPMATATTTMAGVT